MKGEMDEFGRTDIFYAIVEGNNEQFNQLLETTDDINISDINGMNLLHFTCEYNRVKMADMLIKQGIHIDQKDKYGNNPLWKAVFNSKGKYELVDLLVSHGADPNSMNNAGRSPLIFAETIGDEILVAKLKRGSNLA